MLLAALGQKASLALKRADDQSTSLHKVTTNHKTIFFYRSFPPKGCQSIHKLPLLSKTNVQVSFFLLLEKSQLKWKVIALQRHPDLQDPAPDLPVQLQVPPEELPALVQGGGSIPFGQVNVQLTNTDEKRRTGACSLHQARRKTLQQHTTEDNTGTISTACCHSLPP